MSITSMVESTVRGHVQMAVLAAQPEGGAAAANPPPSVSQKLSSAFDQIARYIPSEVLTVYVALIGAMKEANASKDAKLNGFWVTFALVPVVVWCIFAAKMRANALPLPLNPKSWPFWKMIAALVAFTAWAYALPAGPFAECSWYQPAYSQVALLGTTAALALLGGLFDPD